MTTLSVIVPAYNVEEFLESCVVSLLHQPLDCEVIIVDDGSTDSTRDVATALSEQHDRVIFTRQEHQGLSAARNRGVELATGDYLSFCDSDDRVTELGYAPLVDSLELSGSDFASGDVRRFDSTKIWPHPRYKDVFSETRIATHILEDHRLILDRMAWNKVFRRSFWQSKQLKFWLPEYEDAPVMIRAHVYAQSVDVVAEVVYHWRVRDFGAASITQRLHEASNVRGRMTMAYETLHFVAGAAPDLLAPLSQDFIHGDLRVLADAVRLHPDEFMVPAIARAGDFLQLVPPSLLYTLEPRDRQLVADVLACDMDAICTSGDGMVWDPARQKR